MSVFDERLAKLVGAESKLTELERRMESLPKGGGDGTSGGMEARVARLESDVEHIKTTLQSLDTRVSGVHSDVGSIKVTLGKLETSVSNLPGKTFIFVSSAGILTTAAAFAGLIAYLVK